MECYSNAFESEAIRAGQRGQKRHLCSGIPAQRPNPSWAHAYSRPVGSVWMPEGRESGSRTPNRSLAVPPRRGELETGYRPAESLQHHSGCGPCPDHWANRSRKRTLSRQHKSMRTLRFKANSAVGSALAAPRVVAYATAEIENVALTERAPGCSGTTTTVMPVRERVHRALPVPGAAAVLAWRELAFSFLRQPSRGRSGCMYATRSCT